MIQDMGKQKDKLTQALSPHFGTKDIEKIRIDLSQELSSLAARIANKYCRNDIAAEDWQEVMIALAELLSSPIEKNTSNTRSV